jgi:hypothetical protein
MHRGLTCDRRVEHGHISGGATHRADRVEIEGEGHDTLLRIQFARNPTIPQNAAGILTEPPVSVPSAAGTMRAAIAAADPPLAPPIKAGCTDCARSRRSDCWCTTRVKSKPVDVKRLRQLEQENAKLKNLVAKRDLEIDLMKKVAAKKW